MHDIAGKTHWHEPTAGKRAGLRQIRPAENALRPVHGGGGNSGLPRHRHQQGAKPAVAAMGALRAAAAPTSSSTAPKANGAATSSRCPAPARSIPRSTSTKRSITSSKAAAPPRSGSTTTASATCSNGRPARCSRFRSTPGTASSMPAPAPALLLGGTTAPNLMNLINNVDVIFNCPFQFRDRFSGADDFYKYKDDIEPDPVRGLAMRRTNFIPDIVNCDLPLDNRRSPGYRRVEPFMTGNTFYLWIGQHENGRYSKAHAHTSAAVLICLQGQGLHLHLAGTMRRHALEGRPRRPDQARRLRAGRHGLGRARRRALVPPAFRRLEGPAAADRLVRPALAGPRAWPAGRTATPTTPAWRSPKAAPHIPYWMEDPFIRKEYESDARQERRHQNRMEPEFYQPGAAKVQTYCRHVRRGRGDMRAMNRRQTTGGRIFFSSTGRSLAEEDEIVHALGRRRYRLVDIASGVLAHRAGAARQPLHRDHCVRASIESDILLTPYCGGRDHRRRGARRLHRPAISQRRWSIPTRSTPAR